MYLLKNHHKFHYSTDVPSPVRYFLDRPRTSFVLKIPYSGELLTQDQLPQRRLKCTAVGVNNYSAIYTAAKI